MDVINHVVALAAVGIVTRNFFNNVKKEKSCFHIINTTNHSLIKKIIIIIKINQYFGKMLDMSGDSERCTQKEETLVVH